MLILETMSEASPEMRWILVRWLAKFGNQVVPAENPELPGILGVSKKTLCEALKYFVLQGYLSKFRTNIQVLNKNKKFEQFSYQATNDCEYLWRKSLTAHAWRNESEFLLIADEGVRKNKQGNYSQLTAKMRLTMLFLYSCADFAGYVVFPGARRISKALGMTSLEFATTIKKLVRIQELKFASEKLQSDALSEGVYPIYVIARLPYMRRSIKFGVVAERDSLIPMLLDDLFFSSSVKSKYLLDEVPKRYAVSKSIFKNMALTFKNKKLHLTLRHLCLRTLFALVSYDENGQHLERGEKQITDTVATGTVLRARIVEKFFEGVVGEQDLRQALISGQMEGKDLNDNGAREYLKFWMFNQIFVELENTILELSRQFAFLARNYTGPVHLIGWLHRQKMKAKLPEDGPNPPHKVLVGRVLEVLIVEKQSCHDVVLVDQELLAADKDLD